MDKWDKRLMDIGSPLYYYIYTCVFELLYNNKDTILHWEKLAFSYLSWTKWTYNSYKKEASHSYLLRNIKSQNNIFRFQSSSPLIQVQDLLISSLFLICAAETCSKFPSWSATVIYKPLAQTALYSNLKSSKSPRVLALAFRAAP